VKSIKRSVVLITLDCLRADYSNLLLESTLPLLKDGCCLFKRAFANGPGTNQSFPSIFSSTPFLVHGGLQLCGSVRTLAQALREEGYYTVGFHSNPFLSGKLGWGRGFTEFYDFLEKISGPAAMAVKARGIKRAALRLVGQFLSGSSKRLWARVNRLYYELGGARLPYVEARELNSHVVSWLKRYGRGKPLFLWVHYMDTHSPFAPPEPWLEGFDSREEAILFNYAVDPENPTVEDVERLRKLYEGEVKYVAAALLELLSSLQDLGILEKALVIVTADHGEAFMEHGKLGHAYDALYNELLHVPLVIFGLERGGVVEEPVQLMDLAPTVLEALGVKRPRTFMGQSFYSLLRDGEYNERPIFSESAVPDLINLRYDTERFIVSVIYRGWKLIYDLIHSREPNLELYDLRKDFSEHKNLANEKPEIVKELLKLVESHVREVKVKRAIYRNIDLTKRSLRAHDG